MDFSRLAAFFSDLVVAESAKLARELVASDIDGEECARLTGLCTGDLRARLFELSHRVLVAHYQVVEQDVSFDAYCDLLHEQSVREYLNTRYPVMRVAMQRAARAWREQTALLLHRFHADHERLRYTLLPSSTPLRVAAVRSGLGDTHRGGRSVTLLKFDDGRQLLYKPRSLAVDTLFAEAIAWVRERGGPKLICAGHVDGGDYGWVEFIEHRSCRSADEVDAYYCRLGGLLALLHVLEASDIHHENIIAHGDQPVLIDLESLLRPTTPIAGADANEGYDTSVLKVGILPTRFLAPAGELPEVGGAVDAEGALGLERMQLVRDEAGRARLIRERAPLAAAQNLPQLDGRRIALAAEYRAQFERGFEAVYCVIEEGRADFSQRIEAWAGAEVRVLFRHTAAYAHLLSESRHPTLLASYEATGAHFERLRRITDAFPAAAAFVDAEIADLWQGDVPQFTARAGGRDLVCNESVSVCDFFDSSGLDACRRNLARMGARDLSQQLWIIGNTLDLNVSRSAASRTPAASSAADSATPLRERLVALAVDLGERVRRRIRVCGDEASWLVHKQKSLDNHEFILEPAFHDLHSGMPGEILLFQQLARVTGDESYRTLAHQALRHLLRRLEESGDSIRPLGLYAGWGSVMFLLERMASLECDFELIRRAEALLAHPRFDELVAMDREYSVVSGGAGFMLACLGLHRSSGSSRALDLARACANHLLVRRARGVSGHAWRIHSAAPLSGLAHGAAGFAMAFARLHAATGDEAYRDACHGALAYEQTLFVPELGNWRDCRDFTVQRFGDAPVAAASWAHGAPGVGLSRLAILDAGIDSPQIRADLDTALRTTSALSLDGGHSLLAGAFGSLELLLCHRGARSLQPGEDTLGDLCERLLQQVASTGLRLSTTLKEPLGLMPGITGVAYQALRLAQPADVPSILCGVDAVASPPARTAFVHATAAVPA